MGDVKIIRTPEEYWQTLLRAFPAGIAGAELDGFRHTFFCGMSAMISLMAELRDSPLSEREKQAKYGEFANYIHENDGLERG